MFKIKMLCFEPTNPQPYVDEPCINEPDTMENTMNKMCDMAEYEAESLNEFCDDEISFGTVVDEVHHTVSVNYYYTPEGDTTGNTEVVTVYYAEEVQ